MKQHNFNIPRSMVTSINGLGTSIQSIPNIKKIQNYQFNLNQIVGKGNFSHVYKGVNTINNQIVAIKVIQLSMMQAPSLHNLLSSEIDILSKIKHQNILNCLEVFTSANNCYIITQLCDIDLETMITKTGAVEEKAARKIIYDIFEGLKYLAQQQIVHRDIKIANIFLKNGVTKIADFGFAKRSTQNFKDVSIGTPIYMAPQGLIQNVYGPKTDVWALGVVIFQILHANPPLAFCQSQQQLKLHINIPIRQERFKQSISLELRDFIMRCLQVDQRKRSSIFQLSNHPYIQGLVKQFGKFRNTYINNENKNINKEIPLGLNLYSSINKSFNYLPPFKQFVSPSKSSVVRRKSLDPIRSYSSKKLLIVGSNVNISMTQKIKSKSNSAPNFEIIISKLTFQQALQLLHYCRLLFKTRQLILLQPKLSNSPIVDCIGNSIIQLISQLKFKSPSLVIFSGPKAAKAQQKLQGVVQQYYHKFLSTISKRPKIKNDNESLKNFCVSALRYINQFSEHMINRKDQIVVSVYIKYVYDINKIIDSCMIKRNYSLLLQQANIEQFLKIKYQEFNQTHYLPIKTQLRTLEMS